MRSTDKSIAVLPFENLSQNVENAFFADGIHGDLLTQISRIRGIKTFSRTSVVAYRGSSKNLRTIGQELGVRTILDNPHLDGAPLYRGVERRHLSVIFFAKENIGLPSLLGIHYRPLKFFSSQSPTATHPVELQILASPFVRTQPVFVNHFLNLYPLDCAFGRLLISNERSYSKSNLKRGPENLHCSLDWF